jgi:hypothetical protein
MQDHHSTKEKKKKKVLFFFLRTFGKPMFLPQLLLAFAMWASALSSSAEIVTIGFIQDTSTRMNSDAAGLLQLLFAA